MNGKPSVPLRSSSAQAVPPLHDDPRSSSNLADAQLGSPPSHLPHSTSQPFSPSASQGLYIQHAQVQPSAHRSVSSSSSASSLRARASARGGVHMLSSVHQSASDLALQPDNFSSSSTAAQQQRTVSARRGTARPAAFVHESPRSLRRTTSNASAASRREEGGASPSLNYNYSTSRRFSSTSTSSIPYGPGNGARRRNDGTASSNSHSPLINEQSSEKTSPTGSYVSSRADTLDLPFEVAQSSWALGTVTRQRAGVGSGSERSPSSAALTRMERAYPSARVLPFGQQLRILVTGGAGFVGSHLVDRLMMEGHEVLVMDNFFTGSKNNLAAWFGHPNFELLRHDVVNPLLVEVDQIYHLACPASPKDYQRNEVKTLKTCFQGTLNMLGLAKRTRARFLLASTSEVYGDPQVHPQREDYYGNVNPTGWRACYDEGKRVSETLTYAYHQDGVDVRVARIFNTYGPNLSAQDGRVVSNFLLQALKGQPLTVFGDGSQTRSFMYIADLVDGLITLMNREATEVGPVGGETGVDDAKMVDVHSPVNLGNPNEFTVRELVEVVSDVVRTLRKARGGRRNGHRQREETATADALADRLQALKTSAAAKKEVDEAVDRDNGAAKTSEAEATPMVHAVAGPASPQERFELAESMFAAVGSGDNLGGSGSTTVEAIPQAIGPSLPSSTTVLRPEAPPDELAQLSLVHRAGGNGKGNGHGDGRYDDAESVDLGVTDDDEDEDEVVVEYKPLPSDDPRMRCPEITRARELLGWEPRWSLHDGLMQTALYFEALLDDGLI
ncbi:hypothetical protein CF327_g1659 [Tilletia walkeri]|uniref:UDP-glucuronic acid decarboxylase 1 n=1 Tax=Tilletia walkeri TaxID=117179 RepID=A0A8X7NCE6_9BASI|nr:hypothetical protein CF327_g1659 [Tilletia walkeri]KAE8271351.1 hypothetical protein A4X09_0g1022 [Tilletia walkeri]